MIKAVFLDMDDTLIVNQILYQQAGAQLFAYLRGFGISGPEVPQVFDEVDKALFKTHGYSRSRYPATFEAVLRHFIPAADAQMVSIVRGYAENVFAIVADMKPGTPETIELLTRNYPVYIVTAGDKSVQENRVSHLPFKNKLSGVFIVDKKNPEVFAGILRQLKLKPSEAVMMGDSVKSDIIPSVAAGLQAVWIEASNSSPHESAPDFPKRGAYKFSSLLEAARHLVQHGTPAPAVSRAKKISPPKFG